MTSGVDGAAGGAGGAAGGASGAPASSSSFDHPLCRSGYAAAACDGDPHGRWTLVGYCVDRYASCSGAVVTVKGTTSASIEFQDGSPDATFQYLYDYDVERRLSVPKACLGGASCESIGCFAGDDPCACVLGSARGGALSGKWSPNVSGEVVAEYGQGSGRATLRFCAGATTADSTIGGTRLVWKRECTDGMDCRPTNPCHVGRAACGAGAITCEDAGANRERGTVCGADRVCDATGACVGCVAGAACQIPNQPCKTGKTSCSTAAAVCVVSGDVADGTACGDGRRCVAGVCKSDDGAPCGSDGECRQACTCGDAQCRTRFCGRACPCGYAAPGGACAGLLADGTSDPSSCSTKACFNGRCLGDVGQRCATDAECGTGHCTCWLPTCSGGRLCSRTACPCQWAQSGAEACSGPLMDGLMDFSCRSPQACVEGACQ